MGYIYLASPYSHSSARVRCERYWAALQKAADIMATGQSVFYPIAHSHPISEHVASPLAHSFDFWMRMDLPILHKADELWVYQLAGWEESKGITREVAEATAHGIIIKYLPTQESP